MQPLSNFDLFLNFAVAIGMPLLIVANVMNVGANTPFSIYLWREHPNLMRLQAEGLRYALEANRRRRWRNSGSLPWQFNEPYPMAACTSAVDYYGRPKPVYQAVARAYQPLQVTAKFAAAAWKDRATFEAEIWVTHTDVFPIPGVQLTARLITLDGHVYHEWNASAGIPANAAVALTDIECSLTDLGIFFLDLTLTDSAGNFLALNRYPFTTTANFAPFLSAPPTELTLRTDVTENTWIVTITNNGAQTALFVWLDDSRAPDAQGYAEFSDNYFCLFPEEERQIIVTWVEVAPINRSLDVAGWNTTPRRLQPSNAYLSSS